MDAVVELDRAPAPGALYRRAALGMLRGGRGGALPDTTVVLRDVAVSRERLTRYDDVCGFRLSDTLPGTYPHILAFPLAMRLMSDDSFPFGVVGLVHVANRVEVLRPIGADERLDLSVHATDLRRHPRGRQFDVIADATVDGQRVWRGVSTYLRREKTAEPGDAGGRGERDRSQPPAATAMWRVEREVGRRYAEVSGDRNPIHTSRLGARAFGFPRPIAHGMWSAARCLAALEGRLPDAYTMDVAFKLPILLPATVAFSATPGEGGWAVSLYSAKSGKPHLSGVIG
ncbi:MAG TPA: MaoC/PaaZ C-terminal domain-containing protein [Micromonosporaceae bacterium]